MPAIGASSTLRQSRSGSETMDRERFLSAYGSVLEHSPHFAAAVYDKLGDVEPDPETLSALFKEVVMNSSSKAQLELLRAHPELAAAPATLAKLTRESRGEQSGAGLDRCSDEEYEEFRQLNARYRERFGFPFIVAVKGMDRREVLDTFRRRVNEPPGAELETALLQVCEIARMRIEDATR